MAVPTVQPLPLGFRFRPTDVELVNHYLKGKIGGWLEAELEVIPEIDLCKCEPWDVPDKSLIKSSDLEWFFFSPKDRKYTNGHRSNRATEAGYWKATGRDRLIKSQSSRSALIGLKKTLVFYRGRAPNGIRTNWIMHEYRVAESEFESGEQGGFVLCRLFSKSEPKNTTSDVDDCSERRAEVEKSGFSPTLSRSSPGEIQLQADVIVESEGPLNQNLQDSDLQENSQSPNLSNNMQPLSYDMLPENNSNYAGSSPMKLEQSYCHSTMASETANYESDVAGAEVASLLADLAECLGPEGKKLGPDSFDIIHSPPEHYTDYFLCDGFDQGFQSITLRSDHIEPDSITEFLDAVLTDPEECSSEVSNLKTDTTKVMPKGHISEITDWDPCDTLQGKTTNVCRNVCIEDTVWQESIGFSAEANQPPIFSSYLSDINSDVLHMNGSKGHLSVNVPLMDSSSGILHHESASMLESMEIRCSNHVLSNMGKKAIQNDLDSGIQLRTRRHLSNLGSSTEPQSLAMRRLRLQRVIHSETVSRTDDKLSTQDSSVYNSVVTEVGEHNKHLIHEEAQGSRTCDDMEATSSHGNTNPSDVKSASSEVPYELKSKLTLRKTKAHENGIRPRDFSGKMAPRGGLNSTAGLLILSTFLILLFVVITWYIKQH